MIKIDRPLTGPGLKLFRLWLYAPFPAMFLYMAYSIFFSKHLNGVGVIIALAMMLVAFGFCRLICWAETRFGHANLRATPTLIMFGVTIFASIAWPFAFHWAYSVTPHRPNSREDLHLEGCALLVGIMPIYLLGIDWNRFKSAKSTPTPSSKDLES